MNSCKALCGHYVIAVGAEGSPARQACEMNLCTACTENYEVCPQCHGTKVVNDDEGVGFTCPHCLGDGYARKISLTQHERLKRREKLIQEVKDGLSIADASKKYRLCPSYVYDVCKRAGSISPNRKECTPKTLRIVAELQNTKDSFEQIAGRFSCSKTWVRNVYNSALKSGVRFDRNP